MSLSRPSPNLSAYGFLLTATLLWAGNSVAGKMAVGHISPAMLTVFRWLLAMTVIMALSIKHLKNDWPVIKQNLPLLLGYGFVGFGMFNILQYTALSYTSAINVVIEHAGMPLAIFVFNFVLFRIKASWAQIAGFVLTLVGVIFTATHGTLSNILRLDLNIGDALMLIDVLIYAAYTVALRFKPDIHWQSLMAIPTIGALMASLPYLGWVAAHEPLHWPDATGWWIVLYVGLLPSLVAQVVYIKGVELIGANRAGLFINTIPLFGVVLSVIVLKEPIHGFHAVALALVVAGIALAEWGKPKAT